MSGAFSFAQKTSLYPLAFIIAVCQYIVMVCIYCRKDTLVFNSRLLRRSNQIWRRRRCASCKAVFTTNESVDLEKSVVIKEANGFKPLLRDKLFVSLYESLKHRKTALMDASSLTDTVIGRLTMYPGGVIDKSKLILTVQGVLKRFDKVAYIHFTAYHQKD